MRRMGPLSSIFDIITYLILYFIICPQVLGGSYQTLSPENKIAFAALFNAGWFIESLWTQTMIIHTLRPFIQSRASMSVILVTTLGITLGTLLPFTQLGNILGMAPLPGIYFIWLIGIVTSYIILVSIMKLRYIKKYGDMI